MVAESKAQRRATGTEKLSCLIPPTLFSPTLATGHLKGRRHLRLSLRGHRSGVSRCFHRRPPTRQTKVNNA
jgi:hypothetical protein